MKKAMFRSLFFIFLLALVAGCHTHTHDHPHQTEVAVPAITVEEVHNALQTWCDAVVAIGKVYTEGGDYMSLTTETINTLYDYQTGEVFFKPTLAFGAQTFRLTDVGAIAYFAGGNENYPDDKGFALRPWITASYTTAGDNNKGIQIHDDLALYMGNVSFTDPDGNVVTVDKTFAFKRTDDKLKIILHHSSLPFSKDE
jgi:hypothetical protein